MARAHEIEHPVGVEHGPLASRCPRAPPSRAGGRARRARSSSRRGPPPPARRGARARRGCAGPRPLGELGFAQRVVRLEDLERLDEYRLSARGLVVDDPLHRGAVLGLHRHHVAAAALGDDAAPAAPERARASAGGRRAAAGGAPAPRGARRAASRDGRWRGRDLAGARDRVLDRVGKLAWRAREASVSGERRVRMDVAKRCSAARIVSATAMSCSGSSEPPSARAGPRRGYRARRRGRATDSRGAGRARPRSPPGGARPRGDRSSGTSASASSRPGANEVRSARSSRIAGTRAVRARPRRPVETPGEPRTHSRHGPAGVARSFRPSTGGAPPATLHRRRGAAESGRAQVEAVFRGQPERARELPGTREARAVIESVERLGAAQEHRARRRRPVDDVHAVVDAVRRNTRRPPGSRTSARAGRRAPEGVRSRVAAPRYASTSTRRAVAKARTI